MPSINASLLHASFASPALLMLAVLLIPNDVMADARERAEVSWAGKTAG